MIKSSWPISVPEAIKVSTGDGGCLRVQAESVIKTVIKTIHERSDICIMINFGTSIVSRKHYYQFIALY